MCFTSVFSRHSRGPMAPSRSGLQPLDAHAHLVGTPGPIGQIARNSVSGSLLLVDVLCTPSSEWFSVEWL